MFTRARRRPCGPNYIQHCATYASMRGALFCFLCVCGPRCFFFSFFFCCVALRKCICIHMQPHACMCLFARICGPHSVYHSVSQCVTLIYSISYARECVLSDCAYLALSARVCGTHVIRRMFARVFAWVKFFEPLRTLCARCL